MTQKEISVVNAINMAGIGNDMWGIFSSLKEMDVRVLFGTKQLQVVPPHIYVYRDGKESLKVKGVKPDCTVEDHYGQAVDLYFLDMEGGAR